MSTRIPPNKSITQNNVPGTFQKKPQR
jgi:hypothetical protein